jgi:hypothetical protein
MNSPDFAELDPNEMAAKVRDLFRSLHVKTAAAKETAARLETAKAAESGLLRTANPSAPGSGARAIESRNSVASALVSRANRPR